MAGNGHYFIARCQGGVYKERCREAGQEDSEARVASPNRVNAATDIRLPAVIFFWAAAIKAGGEL
jgi:hypothetical protein